MLIDTDPFTGITTTVQYNAEKDSVVLGYIASGAGVNAVLEDNKAAALELDRHRKEAKEEWAHYAKIPTIVQYEWLYKHGVDFAKRDHWPGVMRLLNSPDYRYLKRTTYHHDR
jgi:hypothetical protein